MIGRHEGEMLLQALAHAHRTSARASSAMGGRECLVQVDVHHVEAHVTRAAGTQHGVQVGTVVVHQAATVVDEPGYLRDMLLEEPEGIGIGHHHRGDGITL